ncbi:MAG: hypothetical protein HC827_15000 [Cyanobacteria bacterium RM1_2_2]|nr:hypothetical protein [Cyanobacteria bacterium RM1_2_2]
MVDKPNQELDNSADLDEVNLDAEPTPSYGTGFHDQPQMSVGGTLYDDLRDMNQADPILTGGDVDANWEQANAVGDEAVGGTAPTPDMDVVDELGAAVGLEMDDRAFLRTNEILEGRDNKRWELDPESSEDYGENDAE